MFLPTAIRENWRDGLTLCVAYLSLLMGGCGQIGIGSASLNDATPSGTLVASGQFFGVNGKTASGAVSVYNQTTENYVIHLSGVTLPQENGLTLISVINGVTQSGVTLRSSSGSQNYSVTSTSNASFTLLRLFSPTHNQDYAQANLR